MSVEHCLPTTVLPLMGSSYGVMRPGQTITQGDAGPITSRDWFEYNLKKYRLNMAAITIASDVEEYETFWHHVRSGGLPFWLKEVSSGTHRWMLCGPLADGSQTTFPIPLFNTNNPADLTIFDDEVVQAAGYTAHVKANVMTDNMASFETSTTGWEVWDSCALTRVTCVSADGLASCLVDPTGTVATFGIRTAAASRVAISASQAYTVLASIRGAGSFKIATCYYTGAGASLPTGTAEDDRVWSAGQTCTANGWTQITSAATSQATAATLEITVACKDTTANNFYVDCNGVVPGDLARWHLPSVCPGAVEFASAPAVNSRIAAMGTGYRLTRVRAETREPMWSYNLPYHVTPSDLTLVEDIEI
jgi:hypothetical protein